MAEAAKGRGARSNATGRYEPETVEAFDDGWTGEDEAVAPLRTTLTPERAREIVAERILKGEPFDGEGFEVVDDMGNPAFTLTFRSIVDAHPAR